jgi:Outer membrane protein beta-barrel domain
MRRCIRVAGLAALAVAAIAPTGAAQQPAKRFFIEGLGGAVVPTFDIGDVAKTGSAVGAAVGFKLNERWVVMGEFDYGMHQDKATSSADINTLHYIAKVGYSLTGPKDKGWEALVNLGAGAVTFDGQGAPENFTYPALNAGAKVTYNFNPSFAFVLSPQGDIVLSDEAEITTNNAWVWPVTAGLRVSF